LTGRAALLDHRRTKTHRETNMKRLILAGMLALGTVHAAQADDALKAAIASKERTPANVARDAARHPYETLTFFGIRPDMTVVELAPGGGWYTEILAPYLRDKGKLIVAGESPSSPNAGARRYADNLGKKLAANPAVYGKVQRAVFEPPRAYDIAPANSADMVLTFRNLHNWTGEGDEGLKKTLAEVYKVVKPGGILGIEDHRLPASRKAGSSSSTSPRSMPTRRTRPITRKASGRCRRRWPTRTSTARSTWRSARATA
jgi:predicted methyltransferase